MGRDAGAKYNNTTGHMSEWTSSDMHQKDFCAIASTDHNPKETRKYAINLINKHAIETKYEYAWTQMKIEHRQDWCANVNVWWDVKNEFMQTMYDNTWLWSRQNNGDSCTMSHKNLWMRGNVRWEGKGRKRRTSCRFTKKKIFAIFFR